MDSFEQIAELYDQWAANDLANAKIISGVQQFTSQNQSGLHPDVAVLICQADALRTQAKYLRTGQRAH